MVAGLCSGGSQQLGGHSRWPVAHRGGLLSAPITQKTGVACAGAVPCRLGPCTTSPWSAWLLVTLMWLHAAWGPLKLANSAPWRIGIGPHRAENGGRACRHGTLQARSLYHIIAASLFSGYAQVVTTAWGPLALARSAPWWPVHTKCTGRNVWWYPAG